LGSPVTTFHKLRAARREHPQRFWLQVAYLICLFYILAFWRAIWTPDLLFFMFLLLFALYGQGRDFIINFGPFVVLLLVYDSLRSFAPYLNKHVHYMQMPDFDRWLTHGTLPTIWLQQHLYHGYLTWYDYYFYILYMCHFLTPLLIAIAIWKWRPQHYNRYVTAFLLMSYAGFVTYILFPAAPPWLASQMGYIPHVNRISSDVWWALGVHNFSVLYNKFSPNEVAAVPSLHAAYPTMMFLFIRRAFGWRWALAFSWYPVSMWVGVVYLGEHYVFDVLLGIAYAITAYVVTNWFFNRYGSRVRRWRAWWRERYYPRRPAIATSSVD
jgi:hypothetical protein